MSETPSKVNLDAALREWPDAEKPAPEWEERARSIEARIASGAPASSAASVSDENLFVAPLGQIEGEGHNSAAPVLSPPNAAESAKLGAPATRPAEEKPMTMPADRERDRRSLQDLAKMAQGGLLTPPPPSVRAPNSSAPSGVQRAAEAKADDSGVVDLALAAQADPQAAARAQATPLAQDGLFDDEPASVRPGPVSAPISQAPVSHASAQLQQPMPSMPPAPASLPPASLAPASAPLSAPASAPVASLASGPALAQAEKKKGGKVVGLVLFGLVAASAVAAGGFFVYQGQQAKKAAALAAAQAAEAKPAAPVVAAAPEAKPAEPTAAAEPTPAPEATVDPNALPAAGKTAAAAPKAGAAKAGALAMNAAPSKPEAAAKLSEKDIPTAAAGPAGDLGNAMKSAVGADGKPVEQTPAAGSNGPQFAAGTVPQKPSQGAVTGAIGTVLPAARACLGPDDPISRATITFVSAGTVQSVNVSGGAAGKPAEACIKSALTRAKVAPFMEATYTAPITIRHN